MGIIFTMAFHLTFCHHLLWTILQDFLSQRVNEKCCSIHEKLHGWFLVIRGIVESANTSILIAFQGIYVDAYIFTLVIYILCYQSLPISLFHFPMLMYASLLVIYILCYQSLAISLFTFSWKKFLSLGTLMFIFLSREGAICFVHTIYLKSMSTSFLHDFLY